MKLLLRGLLVSSYALAGLFLAGCGSPSGELFVLDQPVPPGAAVTPAGPGEQPSLADVARFRVGETVIVTFSGIPVPMEPHQETIKEDGTITLPLIGSVYAVGKTSGDLQKEIHDDYVPKYYVRMTVTVQSGDRVVYVGGEVHSPGRVIYMNDMTVSKAIQAAGGLTDFANHRKVWLTHSGSSKRIRVNYDQALEDPAKDPPVYPDDQINVPRSW